MKSWVFYQDLVFYKSLDLLRKPRLLYGAGAFYECIVVYNSLWILIETWTFLYDVRDL
jgi:hypothetical protein